MSDCLFTPREAPKPCVPCKRNLPDGSRNPDYPKCLRDCRIIRQPQVPRDPQTVLANIKSGLEQGVVDPHIKESLSDDFRYTPDGDTQVQFPGFFDGWNKGREVRFMQKILESGTAADSVAFFVAPGGFFETENFGDRRRYSINYQWTLVFPDTTDVYRAKAIWDFVGVEANNVKLQSWEDLQPQSPGDHSSGILRGNSGVR